MKFTSLKTRKAERLIDELENVQRRITERAYEIFRNRGAAFGAALDDWLAAERQTIWKPPIEVCLSDSSITVEAAVPGVDLKDLDIQVTSDTLLIQADTTHTHTDAKGIVKTCEFQSGPLFRLVTLPAPIDPDSVKAEYRNGLLRITAAMAGKKQARKVSVNTS